ncbi:hydrogenase maturation nickel metallochaperone HypA [Aestuariibacter halophilus]|uniref:Hydrogenase maturation factor HypA n=1 Tax=Fluctibacter halophilus TaxID=226011 RepID=A0ABS8G6Y9_9ALTE|nr:hydrogenase maturation nickel metallochaperone HypA [Aestuariibacter halophilus]MCC2615585.1 hydrogenase maturation nickel metallochaperone HypA [Aestuariibacter halophilus]
MHELSVVQALLDTVKQYQTPQDRGIAGITVAIGSLTCVDPERLQFCFDAVREEAGLAAAQLHITPVQARGRCKVCGQDVEIQQLGQACHCGSYRFDMLSGNELNLTEIEFE